MNKRKTIRRTLAVTYLALWLSVIIGGGVLSYQEITARGNAWAEAHPEYCTNQYDYRCGQKNPWGAILFIWMIGYPIAICFASAYVNPRVADRIDKWIPKSGS